MSVDLNFIGQLTKLIRKNKKMSQQILANLAGVDQATVSRIEKGNQNITIPVYELVINQLDLTFQVEYEKDFIYLFGQFMVSLENFQVDKIEEIKNELEIDHHIYYKNYHHHLLLTCFCLLATYQIDELSTKIMEVESIQDLCKGFYHEQYNHLLGVYYLMNQQYEKASSYFEKAYRYCENNKINDGLVYYHYAWNHYLRLNFTTSILALEKASMYFKEKNNQMRLMNINNLIGMIHLNDGNFNEARNIFLDCKKDIQFMKTSNNEYIILRNLAITDFYSGEYQASIEYLEYLYQVEAYRTKTTIFFLLLVLKYTSNPKYTDYYILCQQMNLPFMDKIVTIFQDDIFQIFNTSSIKDLEIIISKYHIYSFIKWIIEHTSKDIYSMRKYSTYKNLFDKFLELRVF